MKKNKLYLFSLSILCSILFAGCSLSSEKNVSVSSDKNPIIEAEEYECYPAVDESKVADRFYYSHLSEKHKLIYRQLIHGIELYDTSISVNADSIDDVDYVINEVLKDCPEYFWIGKENSSNGMINNIGKTYSFIPLYNTEVVEIDHVRNQIDNTVDHLIESIPEDADTYTKVKSVYEWTIMNTDYVEGCIHSQNMLSVFLYHESVCAGYARAFQYIMNRLEIPCIYVEGNAGNPAEPHAWNMVEIDGSYYVIDCTWGDSSFIDESTGEEESNLSYDYLCLQTYELERTHTLTEGYSYPVCDNVQYDYYNLNECYFDVYDPEILSQTCYDSVVEGNSITYIKYKIEEDYLQAKTAIEEGSVLDDAAYYMLDIAGVDEYWYHYLYNDELYTIQITW